MNIHVLSTDPTETFFEVVSADIGDTLFLTDTETFTVVDEEEMPISFSTRWIGGEAIIELPNGNWFSVVGMQKESSDVASTDFASPVSIVLLMRDFNSRSMLSAVRIGGKKLRVDEPFTLESGATVALQATGRISYDPNGAFDGLEKGKTATDVFSYTISNSDGGFAMESVTVTISGGRWVDVFDRSAEDELQLQDISEPLFGTLATLHPNGTVTYFEDAAMDAMEPLPVKFAESESHSGEEFRGNLIQEEEMIERSDVQSPLLGALATLRSDGSIEYTTDSKIAAPVSEGGPVAALSSFLLFPPVLATART